MMGVILCGGQSSRMGSDKGLLKLQSDTWAKIAAAKMEVLSLPTVLSVNNAQYNSYAAIFTGRQLIKDNESIDVKGPLKGVLSTHLQYPLEDLYILACDMPLMETAILKQLQSFSQQKAAEAWVFSNDNALEPLCGIYSAAGPGENYTVTENTTPGETQYEICTGASSYSCNSGAARTEKMLHELQCTRTTKRVVNPANGYLS